MLIFDTIVLPDYNSIEGAFNAKLDAATGHGQFVMHSGGIRKTRPYDAITSANGDILMVGYTQNAVINWKGTIQTKIIEYNAKKDKNDDVNTILMYVLPSKWARCQVAQESTSYLLSSSLQARG